MSNPLRPSAGRRQRQHWNAGPRTLAASLLAAALLAAACSGAADTAAPATTTTASEAAAPAETTAAPAATTAPPETAAPRPLAERCAEYGAGAAEEAAAEARAEMGRGAAADLEKVAGLRDRARLTATARLIGCEDGWTDGDEQRYQTLLAAAETADTTGEQPPDTTAEEAVTDPGSATAEDPPDTEPAPPTAGPPPATTQDPGPAPDDPAWVDELPVADDPAPAPVGAEMVWSEDGLRPLAEARPDICGHLPHKCGEPELWIWEPVRLAVGSRWVIPADPEPALEQELPPGSGDFLLTYNSSDRFTVTGFASEPEPQPGGLLEVNVLLTQEWFGGKWAWRLADGTIWECRPPGTAANPDDECDPPGSRPSAVRSLILPEHADTIERDGAGNMTAATLLVLWAAP